ncbi:Sm-like ribonucleo protein [Metschnikowia bicuspidata]|uniref:Small nuclear ribonucleoprotein Sm D2 n=1 Tax=Metschnikowia bicuspidata TaxID=27322 RepID=A0A4V1J2Y5_9ASCO|nr:Sm-like ribonucleo protein [Metschnikowia bicuspidata]
MAELIDRPRSELTESELQQLEEYEFAHGPLSVLQTSVNNETPVMVYCRNNHKLLAKVKAFDRHCNLILEDVKELWTEVTRNSKGKVIKSTAKERYVAKLFVRGDLVILVVKV